MGLCSTSHIVPEVSGIAFKKCEEWRTDESFQAPIPESLPSPRSTTGDRRLLGGSAATTIPPRVASLEDWTCSTSHTLPEVSGIPFKQCEGCRIDESWAPIPESLPSLRSTTGDSRVVPPRLPIPRRVASLEASGLVPRATPCPRSPVLPSSNVQDGEPTSPSRHPSRNHYPVSDRQPATLGRPRRDYDPTSSR